MGRELRRKAEAVIDCHGFALANPGRVSRVCGVPGKLQIPDFAWPEWPTLNESFETKQRLSTRDGSV